MDACYSKRDNSNCTGTEPACVLARFAIVVFIFSAFLRNGLGMYFLHELHANF
jgi:hypothetical protein